jgi:hypothetical protein
MSERLQYVIDVSGDGDVKLRRFRGELEQTEKAGGRMRSSLLSAAAGITALNQGMELLSKVGRTAAGVLESTLGAVVKRGAELQDMSRRLSISVDSLSGLEFAAKQAGVGMDALGVGFRSLNKALVDSATKGSDANKVLVQQLKFTQAQITAFERDPAGALVTIAKRFNEFEDGAKKSMAAAVLFGQRGAQAFQQFSKDADLEKNIALAKRYGAVLTDEMAAAADRVDDAMGAMGLALSGFKTRLAGSPELLNALGSALESVADTIADVGLAIAEKLTPLLIARVKELGERFEALIRSFDAVAAVQATVNAFASVASVIGTVLDAARQVDSLSPLAKSLLAWRFLGVGGAVASAGRDAYNGNAGGLLGVGIVGGATIGGRVGGLPGAAVGAGVGALGGIAGVIGTQGAIDRESGRQRAATIVADAEAAAREQAGFPGVLSRREQAKRARDAALAGTPLNYNVAAPTAAQLGTSRRLMTGLGDGLGSSGGGKATDFEKQFEGIIREAAARYGIEPSLFLALVKKESSFNPNAISPKGAVGLAQLMPATAHMTRAQLLDPRANVNAGAKELRRLLDRYNGDEELALIGYNAGPDRADAFSKGTRGIPTETQNYLAKIKEFRSQYFGPEATQNAESFFKKMSDLQENMLKEGLSGVAELEAERDQAYRHFADLAHKGQVSEKYLADANLIVWQTYDKKIRDLRDKEAADRQEQEQKVLDRLAEDGRRAAEQLAEEMQRPWLNFADNIQRGFGDLFSSLLQDGRVTGSELVGIFKQAASRLVGELASLAVSQGTSGLLGAMMGNGVTGAGAGFGVAGGQIGPATQADSGGWLSTLGSLFGGGGGSVGGVLGGLGSAGGAGTLATAVLGLASAQSGGKFKLNAMSGGLFGLSAARTLGGYFANTATAQGLYSTLGNSSLGQSVLGGLNLVPQYGVPGGSIGPATATQAGGLASSVSSLVSIVGSLYSLYSSVTGVIAQNKGFKQATLGDRSATQNFAAISTSGLALGTAAGAAVGAVAGAPAAPFTFGASILAGAAVGAAVSAAVSQAIADSVGGATSKASRTGFQQRQLDREVQKALGGTRDEFFSPNGGGAGFNVSGGKDIKKDILGIVRQVGFLLTFGLSEATDVAGLIGASSTPDIDDIFDKIAVKLAANASGGNLVLNRRLTVLGQGTTAAQAAEIAPLGNDRIRGFAKLISVLTGAGTGDQGERLKRFFAIISNSLGAAGFSTAEASVRIDRAVRGVANGSFFVAARQARRAPGDTSGVISAQDLAFARVLPGADLGALRSAFGSVPGGRGLRKDRKTSGAAVAEAFKGVLLGATSLAEFGNRLGQSALGGLEEQLTESVLRSVGGDLLTPLTTAVRKGTRRLRRRGYDDDSVARFTADVSTAVDSTVQAFTAIQPTLEKMKETFNVGLKLAVGLKVASGDMAGATAALESRLATPIATLRGFRQLGRDIRSRTAIALAGPGFPGQQAQLASLGEASNEAFARLRAVNPVLGRLLSGENTAGFLGQSRSAEDQKAIFDPEKTLPLLQEYGQLRLQQLEAELAFARELEAAFGAVRKQGQGLLDAIDVQRNGPRAVQSQFDRDYTKYLKDVSEAGTDPAKIQAAIQSGAELFARAGGLFSPGSQRFQSIRDTILGNTTGQVEAATNAEKYAALVVENKRKEFTAFDDVTRGIIDFSTGAATQAVVTAIDKLRAVFEGDGEVNRLLTAIAVGLNIPLPGRAAGGPVQSGRAYWVGEHGPERFVPSTDGTIVAAGMSAGGVSVTVPITVNAGAGADADAIVATVERAIRQQRGRIVDEIRRVKAA